MLIEGLQEDTGKSELRFPEEGKVCRMEIGRRRKCVSIQKM